MQFEYLKYYIFAYYAYSVHLCTFKFSISNISLRIYNLPIIYFLCVLSTNMNISINSNFTNTCTVHVIHNNFLSICFSFRDIKERELYIKWAEFRENEEAMSDEPAFSLGRYRLSKNIGKSLCKRSMVAASPCVHMIRHYAKGRPGAHRESCW